MTAADQQYSPGVLHKLAQHVPQLKRLQIMYTAQTPAMAGNDSKNHMTPDHQSKFLVWDRR